MSVELPPLERNTAPPEADALAAEPTPAARSNRRKPSWWQGLSQPLWPRSTATEPSPQQAAKQRRKEKIKALWGKRFKGLMQTLLLLALLAGAYVWVAKTPFFTLPTQSDAVQVQGNQLLKTEELQAFFTPVQGQSFFKINEIALGDSLRKRYPLLAQVQVRKRYWPTPQLTVTLSEFQPWGLLMAPSQQQAALAWFERFQAIPSNASFEARQAALKDLPPLPKPQGIVLDSYQILTLEANHGAVQPLWLSPQSILLFLHPNYQASLTSETQPNAFRALDRLSQGLGSLPNLKVRALEVKASGELRVRCEYRKQPLQVRLAMLPLQADKHSEATYAALLKRAMLIKPLLRLLDASQAAAKPNATPPLAFDVIDLRWGKNISLHKQGQPLVEPKLLTKPQPTNPPAFAPPMALPASPQRSEASPPPAAPTPRKPTASASVVLAVPPTPPSSTHHAVPLPQESAPLPSQ